jgi:hypothetical protein
VASFAEQMRVHQASRVATNALERSSRASIEHIFLEWENGILDNQTVRYRLEAVIRSAYRTSAAVAREVASESSGIPEWKTYDVFNTDYLQDLLKDVRRNLRDVKSGAATRAGAISRIKHSAGVAAQRGYTDQIISSYTELEDFGMRTRKYWVANFTDNTPCPACYRLHGTSVGLKETFRAETSEPGVYRDLQGPPRHPNCKCKLYIFIVSLDTAFETPNFESPQEAPQMISTQDVKRMPKTIFESVRASLRAVLGFLRRSR